MYILAQVWHLFVPRLQFNDDLFITENPEIHTQRLTPVVLKKGAFGEKKITP